MNPANIQDGSGRSPRHTLLHWLQPKQLLPSLTVGLLVGLIEVILALSFAALIFAGPLAPFVGRAFGLLLVGAALAGIVISVTSSLPGTISGNQDAPAAVMAVVAAAIVAAMPEGATAQATLVTVIGAIVITSLLTGICFLALGRFGLGGLARSLPFPVIGGFLAGTGWLLVRGAVGLMVDAPPTLNQLPLLFQPDTLLHWLPGALLGVSLLLILGRYQHPFILPGAILAAIALFHLVAWLNGTTIAALSASGFLLAPFPSGNVWQPPSLSELAQAEWPVIGAQIGGIFTAVVVSMLALLLNASGLELATEREVDVNRELRSAGVVTFAAGLLGGTVNFQQLSLSALSYRAAGPNRLTGILGGVFAGLGLYWGSALVALVPKAVLGGILLWLGLSFLNDWVVQTRARLPVLEYGVLWIILLVIAAVGFLEGVAVGLVAAVFLFVVNYSRIDVVRLALAGTDHWSRVTRPRWQQQLLQSTRQAVQLLQLQGYIFFGTADKLYGRIRERLLNPELPALRYVILDFRRVTGIDSTALVSFKKTAQLLAERGVVLLLTDLSPALRRQVADHARGLSSEQGQLFADLDQAVEWCENQLLQGAETPDAEASMTLIDHLTAVLPEAGNLDRLLAYFEERPVRAGDQLIAQGEAPDNLFFVGSGQVTALLESPGRDPVRLETMGSGRVVGEMGFYLRQQRTASVVADCPGTVYRLSRADLNRLEAEEPELASTLHQLIIRLLAERATHLVSTVQALQR